MRELPSYGIRAYALLYELHGINGRFTQGELGWMVSESMRKKTFALLIRSGWLEKVGKTKYRCVAPEKAIRGLLKPRVAEVLKNAILPYELAGASAIEIWSDYSYVQRSYGHSPYFVKILKRDLGKWQAFLNSERVPNYVKKGSTIGEFIILIPVVGLDFEEKDGFKVQSLEDTLREAESNPLFGYAADYIRKKYGG